MWKNIRGNTKLIVFTHASNVLGTIQPIREIGLIAEKFGIPFLVDSAQTAGAYPIDMQKEHISLLAFTGHKSLLGPTGTGGLAINWEGQIRLLKQGGTGGDSSYEYQPDYFPNKYEAGTMNVVGLVGLGASLRYLSGVTVEAIRQKEERIIQYTLDKLTPMDGIQLYGNMDARKMTGAISFNVTGVKSEDVGFWLDREYNFQFVPGCIVRLVLMG